MQLVYKLMDFSVTDPDPSARSFWAVGSTEEVDRQGDIVCASGWQLENFLKNPVIPWAHDYSRPPVAKAEDVHVREGRLVFKACFPPAEDYPFADTIYRLYKGGFLRAFSVGFVPIESEVFTREVDGRVLTGTRYIRQELYEISCVSVPANPSALVAMGLHSPGGNRCRELGGVLEAAVGKVVARRVAYHLGLLR